MITFESLQESLRYKFEKPELLMRALTHKSYRNEQKLQALEDNERLELLGDAVLSLALMNLLMVAFPEESEGFLSKRRSSLVNETTLSEIATELGLSALLRLARGEQITGGSQKPRLLASALEAIIGAVFLDAGFETTGFAKASGVIHLLFESRLNAPDQGTADIERDYKTRLQEWSQGLLGITPVYRLAQMEGPDHQRTFSVEVLLNGEVRGSGNGKTKKQAEQEAAKMVLEGVNNVG